MLIGGFRRLIAFVNTTLCWRYPASVCYCFVLWITKRRWVNHDCCQVGEQLSLYFLIWRTSWATYTHIVLHRHWIQGDLVLSKPLEARPIHCGGLCVLVKPKVCYFTMTFMLLISKRFRQSNIERRRGNEINFELASLSLRFTPTVWIGCHLFYFGKMWS